MKTVIEMAREAGFNVEQGFLFRITGIDEDLERLAELIRADAIADEREACAKVADGYIGADPIAAAIRARGQA
jgi:hypothetical protein